MQDWLQYTDGELMDLMIAGDENAFAEIYRRKQPALFRFAVHMSGSSTLAEDAMQEVFLALIECASTFDPERGSLSAFLFGIARKQILRLLEKRSYRAQREAEEFLKLQDIPVSSSDPLHDVLRGKTIGMVRAAILTLPSKYREVVVLCDLHEFSYEETAGLIHVRVGTVRSRLHRARQLLMRKLVGDENNAHASKDPEGGKSYELSTL
jgi:RNA polymerase sigma-70 factor (ECF subfamily)